MEQIAFTTVTFRQKTRGKIIEIAGENCIEQIEWGGDLHLKPRDTAAREEVARLQGERGITACSYGSYYRLGMNDMAEWQAVIETAAVIGAKTIRVWAGEKSSGETDEAEFAALVAEARELAAAAEEKGLQIAFEFHQGTYNDTGASSTKLLERIHRDNVKTYWQPLRTTAELEDLETVLPYLAGVHVFHWSKKGLRYPLKFGWRKWERFLRLIAESGADVPYIIEFVKDDSERQFARDVKTLRALLSRGYGV